jgi:hypothetical protein
LAKVAVALAGRSTKPGRKTSTAALLAHHARKVAALTNEVKGSKDANAEENHHGL